ncbi:MAG: hypothetical protein KVP17_003939 [Porospora cf. gigantea B]|uniref:uncharacterized protein n=1 Tax=Porospora cf. gigantea B TaxID=2853592 RepID=UPI003571DE0E|nr:MAG: hypothetical protein KVP17_003939 [Porospora cf. gigantea B]
MLVPTTPKENVKPQADIQTEVHLVERCEELLGEAWAVGTSSVRRFAGRNLRTTLKELEALVDSARERERSNFANLEAVHRNVEEIQRKHSRHKEAAHTERSQLHAQLESLTAALHDCSSTNKSLTKHNTDLERRESPQRENLGVVSLAGECDGLKRKVAHLVDEDEALKLKTRVRKLEDENVLLAGEKVRLQTELQEKCTLNTARADNGEVQALKGKLETYEAKIAKLQTDVNKYQKWTIELLDRQDKKI